MVMSRTRKIANILRILSVVTTAASLLWAIYATNERNDAEDAKQNMEAVLLQQVDALIDATQRISELNTDISIYKKELDSLMVIANDATTYRDSILKEIAYRDYIIENIKEQLNEDITIIDADDDEQLRIFLEWSELE